MADDSFAMGYALGNDASSNRNNNDGGFGGANSWIWIIVVFALLFGWGNNGNRGGSGGGTSGSGGGDSMAAFLPYIAGSVTGGQSLTRGELCQDMNFADVQAGVRNLNDAVNVGFANVNNAVCQQSYETAQLLNGVNNNINSVTAAVNGGFSALNATICQNAYENAGLINGLSNTVQQGFNASNIVAMQNQNALQAQIANCCCENRAALADLKYTIATEDCATRNLIQTTTRDMIDNQNAGFRAVLDYLSAEKIASLQNENQALRLSASQQAQNNYLISQLRPQPVPAYPATSPCGLGNWSPAVLANGWGAYNGGCGCNCGF